MMEDIKKRVEQFHMLRKGERVLIGLSGGADSVCLAQLLYEWTKEYALTLGAIYCHHGIRGKEADEDGIFVRDFCAERGISFYETSRNVEECARLSHQSVEEAGREFRYESYRAVMEREHYSVLALAHNGDDRAETMLFHLARGTGLSGLCTMEPVRSLGDGRRLIRPLLWTKKSQIEAWLRGKKILWRTDRTNLTDIYTRNRIRHRILPELEEINIRAVAHMGETAEILSEIRDYLKEEEERVYRQSVLRQEISTVVSIPILREQHLYMKKAVLYRCLAEQADGEKDITSVHVDQLLDLMEGETGRSGDFPKGIRVQKEYERLVFSPDEQEEGGEAGEKPDDLDVSMRKFPYNGQEILKNEYTKQFDCAKIRNRLCFRFWQQGDYLYLKEDGGKKKLSRYFIDEKIPPQERGRILLLADGSHILWVVGHRISAYYKVTEKTETILEVTIKNKG